MLRHRYTKLTRNQICGAINGEYELTRPIPGVKRDRKYVRLSYILTRTAHLFADALDYNGRAYFLAEEFVGVAAPEFRGKSLLFRLFPDDSRLGIDGIMTPSGKGFTSVGFEAFDEAPQTVSFPFLTAVSDRASFLDEVLSARGARLWSGMPLVTGEVVRSYDALSRRLGGDVVVGNASEFFLPHVDYGCFEYDGDGALRDTKVVFTRFRRTADDQIYPLPVVRHGYLCKPCQNIRQLFEQVVDELMAKVAGAEGPARRLADCFDKLYGAGGAPVGPT